MKNYKTYYFLIIFFISLCSYSCKKLIEIPPPKNEIVTSQVFADSADATSAVLGIYINMTSSLGGSPLLCDGGTIIYTGLSGDELTYTSFVPIIKEFAGDAISPMDNNDNTSYLWRDGYQYIYEANACIAGLSSSTGVNLSTKNELIGEVEFLRAYFYFNLSNLYGPVPLVKTTAYTTSSDLPRAPIDSIYYQMVNDLISAANFLPANYVTSGKARPNKYTALALLSKVYLYHKDWKNAEATASQIINSGTYSLENNLNNVFLTGSSEAIWQIDFSGSPYIDTYVGFVFVPSSATSTPEYIISNSLLNAFEPGDLRYSNWLNSNTVGGNIYYYPFKYKSSGDPNQTYSERYEVFRLAEQYLIRAEAEANGAGAGLSGAITDLNLIRTRAGLPNYAGAQDQASVLTAIMHERQVELFCEEGNRWYDLKRSGTINVVLGACSIVPYSTNSTSGRPLFSPKPRLLIEILFC